MMIFSINYSILFDIIHLCCYILALIPSMFLALSIDYPKFFKAKSNKMYYLFAIVIGIAISYLVGEFLYNIFTMFIN